MHNFFLLLFALAGGMTLSAIVANLYRLVATNPKNRGRTYYAVMLLAGPSVLLGNSTRSFRKKQCSRTAYGFAVGLAAYWAFMLGAALLALLASI